MSTDRHRLSRRVALLGTFAAVAGLRYGVSAQTPAAVDESFVDRIDALLALLPADLIEASDEVMTPFSYADFSTQLASLGLTKPVGETMPDGLFDGIQALPVTHAAFRYALTPEWADTFGFWPLEIDRVLVAGEPPNVVAVFAGVDGERVTSALIASGYREVLQEIGGSYLSFGDDVSPTSPVGRLGIGAMNRAVIRDDIAIFAHNESTIQQVTLAMSGLAPSILDTGGWPALMTTFASDTVGLIAVAPEAVVPSGDSGAIQQIAFGVQAGATAAGSGDEQAPSATAVALPDTSARVAARIRYADATTAAAEATLIPARWAEMTSAVSNGPFTDLMVVAAAGVAEGDPTVAAIDFRVNGPPARWYQLIFAADFAPFVPQT